MKILIAEDNAPTREIMAHVIQSHGHEVILATDGMDAWQLCHTMTVDAIFCDWQMPRLDGLALCQTLRSHYREKFPAFVLYSGSMLTPEEQEKAKKAGIFKVLKKPISHEQLSEVLSEVSNRPRVDLTAKFTPDSTPLTPPSPGGKF